VIHERTPGLQSEGCGGCVGARGMLPWMHLCMLALFSKAGHWGGGLYLEEGGCQRAALGGLWGLLGGGNWGARQRLACGRRHVAAVVFFTNKPK
jgi:hypothetical protein